MMTSAQTSMSVMVSHLANSKPSFIMHSTDSDFCESWRSNRRPFNQFRRPFLHRILPGTAPLSLVYCVASLVSSLRASIFLVHWECFWMRSVKSFILHVSRYYSQTRWAVTIVLLPTEDWRLSWSRAFGCQGMKD